MDLDKLDTADKVIAGSAIVLFISMFLPWFSFDVGQGAINLGNVDANGFDVGALWGLFPMLMGLVMLAYVAIRAFSPDTELPDLPWAQVMLGLGIAAGALVTLKLLIGEDFFSRSWGLFVATAAAIGLAVGGFLKFQADQSGGDAPLA